MFRWYVVAIFGAGKVSGRSDQTKTLLRSSVWRNFWEMESASSFISLYLTFAISHTSESFEFAKCGCLNVVSSGTDLTTDLKIGFITLSAASWSGFQSPKP